MQNQASWNLAQPTWGSGIEPRIGVVITRAPVQGRLLSTSHPLNFTIPVSRWVTKPTTDSWPGANYILFIMAIDQKKSRLKVQFVPLHHFSYVHVVLRPFEKL